MNRKVKYLKAHSSIFMGGTIGTLGDTLPSAQKTLDLDMTATPEGVIVKAARLASPTQRGGKETALIPYGNIQVILLIEEDKPAAKSAS